MKLSLPILAATVILLGMSAVKAADTPAGTNAETDKNPSMTGGKTQSSDPKSPTTGDAPPPPSTYDNPAATGGKTEDSDPRPK